MANSPSRPGNHRPPHARDDHDGRRDAPAFHRNHRIITEQLRRILGREDGDVLEIGSGSGQHITAFARAFANFTWWPTDNNPRQIKSIDAWRHDSGLDNLAPPAVLDAASYPWMPEPMGAPLDTPQGGHLDAIICINVAHISPWDVTLGLFRGAGRYLNDNGHLVLYGPFKRDGVHTAPSNAAFDAQLRRQDPAWGVRDMAALETAASVQDLTLDQIIPVPANNFILVFGRTGSR